MARITIYAGAILPVAIHTPCHIIDLQGRSHLGHRSDVPVTFLALNTFGNVRIVVEIDKVRKVIDFRPSNRLMRFPRLSYFYNFGLCRCNEFVAAHACLDRWDIGVWTPPNTAMTILAVDFVIAGMADMAECDRLARTGFRTLTRNNEQ
ncbi:MAG: hypothetical protein WBD36_04815 [Bacteroidota bacterium]